MQADFSVELGHDDPVLELPWISDNPSVRYYDLKSNPELVRQIPEAAAHPELSAFLTRINAPDSPLETAKCDLWQSNEISAEEEIFGASQKFVSYIDLVFTDEPVRSSFEKHEKFADELCHLLNRAPDIAATVELIIRRCYYRQREASGAAGQESSGDDANETDGFSAGFYLTAYVSGFGDEDRQSQRKWSIAVSLLQHALVQLSSRLQLQ